ncbi:MAG: hypothetical protein QNJ43_24395 [Breoghania sp.]|nr:hypothetical protein [Breoghania sp.]
MESLEAGNALFDAVLTLNEGDACTAFEQLSGESQASFQSTLVGTSSFARNVVGTRISNAFDGIATNNMAMIALNGEAEPGMPTGLLAWAQAYGSIDRVDGDGNSADQDNASGGLFVGLGDRGPRGLEGGSSGRLRPYPRLGRCAQLRY